MKCTLVLLLALAPALAAGEPPLSGPLVLVARPDFRHPVYGSTVIAVTPARGGRHMGFILNRPTGARLGKMFPDHAPSRAIDAPVYFGGPLDVGAVFALVVQPESPGDGSLEIAPGLHVTLNASATDAVIESSAHAARFVTGFVLWRSGELGREIEHGVWYVRELDPALVLSDAVGLWQEQVRRALREASLQGTRHAP